MTSTAQIDVLLGELLTAIQQVIANQQTQGQTLQTLQVQQVTLQNELQNVKSELQNAKSENQAIIKGPSRCMGSPGWGGNSRRGFISTFWRVQPDL